MTRLIDADKLKEYIDDCKCCEKCDKIGFMCNYDCELPDVLTPQWERVLDEQPTVDAIPVSFIQDRIDSLKSLADYEAEANGGYTGQAHTQMYELRRLINYWKEERDANQDKTD